MRDSMKTIRVSVRCTECFGGFRSTAQLGLRILVLMVCALLISAAPNAKPDDLIREGNQAFEKDEFDAALQLYQEAEERGTDPGVIAFNIASVYWRLGDFRKAENHYRMALNDAEAPADRRAKAFFNLGNCLVKQSEEKDYRLLRDAIRYYEYSLDLAVEAEIRKDATYNLELAKLLWNKARIKNASPPTPNTDEPPDTPRQPKAKDKPNLDKKENAGKQDDAKDPNKELNPQTKIEKGSEVSDPKKEPSKIDAPPQAGPGRVPVIPDKDELVRHSTEDTRLALKLAEDRLNAIRQRLRAFAAIPEKPSGKDW